MIHSFRHRALQRFYEKDETWAIAPRWRGRMAALLARLDAAAAPSDMELPGLRLHRLRGDLDGFWSIDVSRNWRMIFRFDDGDAYHVDLVDYH